MTRTILLALDGSAKDERGIAVAAAFAELADASVHVIRVVNPPGDLPRTAGVLAVLDAVHVPHATVQAALDSAARDIRTFLGPGAKPTTELVEAHDVAAAILRVADARSALAIVLATRAAGAIGRAIHGSVADAIVRNAERPVLLVPPRTDDMRGHRVHFRRVLVPLDGSDAAQEMIAHIRELARVELVLLRVLAPDRIGGHAMPPSTGHAGAEHAESHLREVADRLRATGVHSEVRVLESGDPAGAIVAAVREELVDLIAMTTRGAGGARRMLHGSVATRVARESEVPVLLVTPSA